MRTARSLVAALTLALTAISCSDKGPTEANNLGDNQNPTPVTAQAAQPIIQSVTGDLEGGGTFSGTVTIKEITRVGDRLFASGTLVGTATQGTTVTQITQEFSRLSVTSPAAPLEINQVDRTCRILELDIGAIHLDLLGLVVDLAPIHLDITAERGPGNLLGNLLCALVGILDQGNFAAIDRLLQQINAILGGL
jgi:hypothetical protein